MKDLIAFIILLIGMGLAFNVLIFGVKLVALFFGELIKKPNKKPVGEPIKCEDGYSPKYFIIEKHGVLKAYKADGNIIGEFIGYATWDDNMGEFRISKT